MKKILPLLCSALALSACGSASSELSFQQISMDAAITQMAEEDNFILLDVRTPEEFADGHIPGAINIPNESIGENDITELPDKEQRIYVYCRSGNRSKQASQKLADMGYTNIFEFGGINDWTGETYPHEGCSIPPENDQL